MKKIFLLVLMAVLFLNPAFSFADHALRNYDLPILISDTIHAMLEIGRVVVLGIVFIVSLFFFKRMSAVESIGLWLVATVLVFIVMLLDVFHMFDDLAILHISSLNEILEFILSVLAVLLVIEVIRKGTDRDR